MNQQDRYVLVAAAILAQDRLPHAPVPEIDAATEQTVEWAVKVARMLRVAVEETVPEYD